MSKGRFFMRLLWAPPAAGINVYLHGIQRLRRRVGLLPEDRYRRFLAKREGIGAFRKRLEETRVTAGHPLLACDPELRSATREAVEQAELSIKYDGYIRRQEEEANKLRKYEEMRIPPSFPFETVPSLSAEVRDKLVRVRPDSIGQAQRIPGVTPAAVALLLVYLRRGGEAARASGPGEPTV